MDTTEQVLSNHSTSSGIHPEITCSSDYAVAIPDFIGCVIGHFSVGIMRGERKSQVLFFLCLKIFILHQFIQKVAKIEIAILDSYLDPLLLMPILLHLIAFERSVLTNDPEYTIPLFYIIIYVVIVSVLAEIVFPIYTQKLISDPLDVVFYIIGAGLYAFNQRPVKIGIPEFLK